MCSIRIGNFTNTVRVLVFVASAGVAGPTLLAANIQTLHYFAENPYGDMGVMITADGQRVVGDDGTYGEIGFVWTDADGIISHLVNDDGGFGVLGMSGDGSTLVGAITGRDPSRPVVSTIGRRQYIFNSFYIGYVEGASYDGSVAVGASRGRSANSVGFQAFRWSESTGVESIVDYLPEDARPLLTRSWANAISDDGMVAVGAFAMDLKPYRIGTHGYIWQADSLQLVDPLVEGGTINLNDVSADGQFVVGSGSDVGSARRALWWSEEQGLQRLDQLSPTDLTSSANAISADGSTIVGRSGVAVLWDDAGVHDIRTMLIESGVENLDSITLDFATDVSSDGRFVVGVGHDQQKNYFAWRADLYVVPEPPALPPIAVAATGLLVFRLRGRCVAA